MDQSDFDELKQKQDEMLVLVKKLWRAEQWRRVYGFLKILLFVVLAVGSYFALQPLLDTIVPLFGKLQGIQSNGSLPLP